MSKTVAADGGRPPERIGRYEVRAFLGAGGFAMVYEGWDEALDTHVAIKVLDPSDKTPQLIRDRFLAEAKLLRRVDSPHVVTVYDIGELSDGRPYFVMEFADSGALSARIPSLPGLADPGSLRTLVDGLAAAMTALHEAGIVHRDIKPENVLLTHVNAESGSDVHDSSSETIITTSILGDGERVVLGDLGIAKDTAKEDDGPTILAGTPSFRAPEQTRRGADITPTTDIYGATGVLWNLLTATAPPESLEDRLQLDTVPEQWREVITRGLDPDPAKRFPTAAAWADACHVAIGDTESASPLGFAPTSGIETCPYKGLAAFQPDDAGLFFGREALVDELVRRMQTATALVVGGPSGSGKSSLVRAGLLPALRGGVLPGAQHWKVALFTPRTDAMGELAFQLSRIADDDSITAARLQAEPAFVRRILETGPPVMIAIDQFEELFTINEPAAAGRVVDVLNALTEGSHSTVKVVVAVRADFYDSCAQHRWLAETINENQVLVGPMGSAELRRAIEGPAHRTGLQLEPGLVDTIIDDAGANAGSLPLLAHALMETWIRRRGHQMTLAGYRAAGGVAGAIAQRAEETYAKLSAADQLRARELVLQMTSPGESGPDTRRVLAWKDVGDMDGARPVIDTFVNARLLTTSDQNIELAHETLLRSWPRAREWIDDARDDLRTRIRLDAAAADWDQRDRDPGLLLRGTPLESSLDWEREQSTRLLPVTHDFLDAARLARDRAEANAEATRSRGQRNRRLAFSALAILLVAAVIQSINASNNADVAGEATAMAETQINRGLAATAEAQAPTDPLFAVALAAESAARNDTPLPESLGALATARVALFDHIGVPVPLSAGYSVGNVLQLEMTADGSLLILGDRDGGVTFFDVDSREVISTDHTHTKGVESITIHEPLNLAVTGGADGQILLWDLTADPIVPEQLDVVEGLAVWSAEVSPNGELLSAITSDAGVTFYDLASRQQLGERFDSAGDRDALRSVFTADGRELLVGNSKGELIRIDTETRSPVGVLSPHETNIWDIERSPNGRFVYSASNDGTLRRVDLSTMELDESFIAGNESEVIQMRGVEASNDGSKIITGAFDGHLQVWDAETGELIARSTAAHDDAVIDGAASADGTLYVSLGDDQKIRFWDLGSSGHPTGMRIDLRRGELFGLASHADGTRAVGTADGVVLIFNTINSRTPSAELNVGDGQVWGLAFAEDGRLLAGDGNGRITLWDGDELVATNNTVHSGRIMDIALSPNGRFAATASLDGRVELWDAETLEPLNTIAEVGTEVYGVEFATDDDLLSVDREGRVGFWNANGGASADLLQPRVDILFAVDIDPTGELMAVASGAEAIAVLDRSTGDEISRLTPLPGGAADVAFLTESVVVSLSQDGVIALWNARTGDQLGPSSQAHDPDSATWRMAIDDRLGIWTVSGDGTMHRLDILDLTIACDLARDVFDEQRQSRFLADDDSLRSCQ